MKITVRGKKIDIDQDFKKYCQEKVAKVDTFTDGVRRGEVVIENTANKDKTNSFKVQITLTLDSNLLRAEETGSSPREALDLANKKLQSQARRYVERSRDIFRRKKQKSKKKRKTYQPIAPQKEEKKKFSTPDYPNQLVRRKKFKVQKMDIYEAIEKMELLDHDFFLFKNGETDQLAIIYRRKMINYGLIEPELDE